MIRVAYVDYSYYEGEYLCGRDPDIPDDDFIFWEKKARAEIDRLTFGRIPHLTTIPDEVRECTCAVAELLYKADRLTQANLEKGVSGALTSYSNDGQSGSFDVSQSAYTETGRAAEIRRLCHLYLGNTGLLFTGVVHYES